MPAKGKLGLALSGGGFRASFFHIGVLARLAELDLLRPIEIISTVSGGSIIGAAYYLHLKNLLESKDDRSITPQDYVEIIRRIEQDFRAAVEKNIRTRVWSNLSKNLLMVRTNYSRSDRVSELLDKYFYAPITGRDDIPMVELKIHPKGERSDFHPRRHNSKRKAKVPQLIINATSLNTGHSWQFTASFMGEPVAVDAMKGFFDDVDKNMRLRRLYYHESSVPKINRLPLRVAVAASAAVPGIFPPLPITDLYPGITVQLSDGGVHDNQGLAPLLDTEGGGALCNAMIVSDASGQMEDEPHPSPSLLSVLPRTNAIMMDRVRDLELLTLDLLKQNNKVTTVHFVHLKKDLVQPEKIWIGGTEKREVKAPSPDLTFYNVDRTLQMLLARMRTDLDSFSEVEAFSLMCDAYLMTDKQLAADDVRRIRKQLKLNYSVPKEGPEPQWEFQAAREFLVKGARISLFRRQLQVSSDQAFKAFKLLPWLNVLWVAVLGLFLWGIGSFLLDNWQKRLDVWVGETTLGDLMKWLSFVVAVLLGAAIPRTKSKRNRWRELLVQITLALLGFVVSNFSLSTFDPLFRWQGRMKRLLRHNG